MTTVKRVCLVFFFSFGSPPPVSECYALSDLCYVSLSLSLPPMKISGLVSGGTTSGSFHWLIFAYLPSKHTACAKTSFYHLLLVPWGQMKIMPMSSLNSCVWLPPMGSSVVTMWTTNDILTTAPSRHLWVLLNLVFWYNVDHRINV